MQSLRSLLQLDRDKQRLPITEQLKRDGLPVVMWGAGNVGHSVKAILENAGVKLNGIWVDGEHPDNMDGIPIRSYEQTADTFGKFNVVCGHSRYDIVAEAERSRPKINKIYCFSNVVYGQFEGISSDFIEEHFGEYEEAFNLLEDDFSRKCFAAYLNCRNNDDYTFLLPYYVNTVGGGGGESISLIPSSL